MLSYRTRWAHTDRHRVRSSSEGPPHALVIHTSEQAFPTATNGETLADVIAGPKIAIPNTNPVRYNQASYHWCVDLDTVNHMVAVTDIDGRDDIAYHAPPNWHGESICLTGRAGRDWTGVTDGTNDIPQLILAAQLVAQRLQARGWPVVKLSPADLVAGKQGVCGHVDISNAWHATDHTDPGVGFPWDWFLTSVAKLMHPPTQEEDSMKKLRAFVRDKPALGEAFVQIEMKGYDSTSQRDVVGDFHDVVDFPCTEAEYNALKRAASS